MNNTNSNPNISLLILTVVLLGISFVLIGCGSLEDDNDQPSIETITDSTITTDQMLTLAVNSSRTVEVYISDVDEDDRHTINAASENTDVSTVSLDETMHETILTITGIAVGSTTVTITATDGSGANNATAEPVFFDVTVIEPQVIASTPSPLADISLQGSVVSLTLVGLIYERYYNIYVRDSVTVSGIADLRSSLVEKVSDTEVRFGLSHSPPPERIRYPSDAQGRFRGEIVDNIGNIDTDATLTFTVEARAIAGYDGPPLTAQIPVAQTIDIHGPWLWMVVPTDPNAGAGVSTEIDSLAKASNNRVTEADVAIRGVSEGETIGQFQWTSGSIWYTHRACERLCSLGFFGGCGVKCWQNNINDLLTTPGFGTSGNLNGHTAYALINLISPSDQDNAVMSVKSSDAIKMWLNGEVIHRDDATALECRTIHVANAVDPTVCTPDPSNPTGYSIPVKLKAGDNLLLVKVRHHGDYWGIVVRLTADFTTSIPQRRW